MANEDLPASCRAFAPYWIASMRETELIRSLRAVRQFSDREISRDVLQDILEVGRWTGSSKNTQPWDLLVVRHPEPLTPLSKCREFSGHLRGPTLARTPV